MRKEMRACLAVRDLMDIRAAQVRCGVPFDPSAECVRARRVVSILVEAGLVPDGLWFSLPLTGVGADEVRAAIDYVRAEVDLRVAALPFKDALLGRLVVGRRTWEIASLVVEVACYAAAMRTVHAGCASYVRREGQVRQSLSMPADPLVSLRAARCFADPEGFLADAEARTVEAKDDIRRARERMRHLRAGRVKALAVSVPPLATVEDPATRSAAEKVPGTVPDLFAGVAVPKSRPAGRVESKSRRKVVRADKVGGSLPLPADLPGPNSAGV